MLCWQRKIYNNEIKCLYWWAYPCGGCGRHQLGWHLKGELVDIFEQDYLRQDDEEITLYKCVGVGYFDLAVTGGVMKMFAK